jgi:hypothetical protein
MMMYTKRYNHVSPYGVPPPFFLSQVEKWNVDSELPVKEGKGMDAPEIRLARSMDTMRAEADALRVHFM